MIPYYGFNVCIKYTLKIYVQTQDNSIIGIVNTWSWNNWRWLFSKKYHDYERALRWVSHVTLGINNGTLAIKWFVTRHFQSTNPKKANRPIQLSKCSLELRKSLWRNYSELDRDWHIVSTCTLEGKFNNVIIKIDIMSWCYSMSLGNVDFA